LIEPVSTSILTELDTSVGSLELDGVYTLESEMGFSYRVSIGELIYTYVIWRPNIGYDINKLAIFSDRPVAYHYIVVKRVVRYLQQT